MSEINCPHRSQAGQQPVCQIVSDVSGLPILDCHVNDDACRHCLELFERPTTPNQVVASMVVVAGSKSGNPDLARSLTRRMQPYLLRLRTAGPKRATADELPCIHRGEVLRQVDCELCGDVGTKIDVHQCNLPGKPQECTAGPWSKTAKEPSQTCISCSKRSEVRL